MKRAIVLSGGGSKGAYQIGVWAALRKLNIKYDIVTGTSVGALNGALMVQNTFYRGLFLWKKINFNLLFQEKLKNQKDPREIIKMYSKNILKNKGMEVTKLENLLKKYIDEQKVFTSKIDFGLITVKSPSLTPLILTKNQIQDGMLCDYLMASATCFPAFKKKNIEDQDYIDGGYYDNLPINLAISLGAEEIIAIDLKAIGIKQKIQNENIPITYITPNNHLTSFLIFDPDETKKAIALGYNDTMKVFGKLEGNHFTFKKRELTKNNQRKKDKIKNKLTDLLHFNQNIKDDLLKIASYKRIINNKKDLGQQIDEIVDFLGISYKIDPTPIYKMKTFEKKLWEKMNNDDKKENKITEIYHKLITCVTKKDKIDLASTSLLFPKETLAAIYLSIMK